MNILNRLKILKGKQRRARKVLLYGVEGVGKSTWAAGAPRPIFLNFEDGVADIEVDKTERLTSYPETLDAMRWLHGGEHDYQSVVFDTVDWFERLVQQQVCENARTTNIEKVDGGFGKGYVAAASLFQEFLQGLEMLSAERRLNIIMLGHCTRAKVQDPERESYETFTPDLHKLAAATLREWCDEVLFASYRTFTRTEDEGFSKKRTIAVGGSERFIRANHSAGVQAKNRLDMPDEIPFPKVGGFAEYMKFWPSGGESPAPQTGGNIAGVVVDGSSKRSA